MPKSSLVILGILIIVGLFLFTNVLITPQQKTQINWAKGACNFPLFGSLAKGLSGEVANRCAQYEVLYKIFQFSPYIYGIGGILLFFGLIAGGRRERIVEKVIYVDRKRKENKKEKPAPKHCPNCGTKIKAKYCNKCGKKVRK